MDFLSYVGEASDVREFFNRAIHGLSTLIPCDQAFACFADILGDPASPHVWLMDVGGPQSAARPYVEYYFHKDPIRKLLSPRTSLYQVDWRSRRFFRDEFANEFARGLMRIDMNAGIPLFDPSGQGAMTFGFARAGAGRRLSARDAAILRALRPHFVNYYALFKGLERLEPAEYHAAELAKGCRLLSWREAEVAVLLCRRYRNAEIASRLSISPRTVERHVEHIYFKLNVHTRADLIRKLLGLCE